MSRLLCLALLVAASAAALTSLSFDDYITHYGKRYTHSEYRVRKAVYEERVAAIAAHNQAGKSYTRTINQFTDQTETELASLMGMNKHRHYTSGLTRSLAPLTPRRVTAAAPSEIDWSKNSTTGVKNQGGCGSCWAFAGTEAIESCLIIETGKSVQLAPQQYVDCVENKQQCGGSGGCEGATPDLLFQYASTGGGAVKESDYPYVARDGTCKTSIQKTVNVSGYTDIENNNYDAMMAAIVDRPIAIGVAANEWFSYDSGVFSFDDCGSDVNHAVLLVGYGTDESHGDYWKVQNSWGSTWGEDGFIRLARSDKDSSNCQIDKTPLDGFGCKGGPSEVKICGTCGLLYGAAYPKGCSLA